MSPSLSGRRTVRVSSGLLPVDSGLVQVASAPVERAIASRRARASSIKNLRVGSKRTDLLLESDPMIASMFIV